VPDGGNGDIDGDPHKDVAGRLLLQPFRNSTSDHFRGLGLGIAGSRGRQEGTTGAPGLASYRTVGQQPFFAYRSSGQAAGTVLADGHRTRVSPQGFWYFRALGVVAEYVRSRQEVRRDSSAAELTHTAWQGTATLVLTGEDASASGVRPRTVFDPRRGTLGAVELAARGGALTLDRDAFPIYADPSRSASAARHWGAGVNWYLNRNVRISADYDHTRFSAAAGATRREAEQGILTRVQLSF
jgi:phosphate-selective porin OprO and OprP